MNALFGEVIKVFLALVQAQYAVGQDDGYGADGGDGRLLDAVATHAGIRFM
jgi:hypothetical protein